MKTQDMLRQEYPPCAGQGEHAAPCACQETHCVLHGQCCACVAWHRDYAAKPLPSCLRNLDGVTWKPRR